MALSPRLDLRQTQTLIMTPQLQQAIKLLQLSNIELSAYVEQQLEQNPLLERDDDWSAEGDSPLAEDSVSSDGIDLPAALQSVDRALSDDSGAASQAALDGGLENVFDSEVPGSDSDGGSSFEREGQGNWNGGQNGYDRSDANLENVLPVRATLREHLTSQITIDIVDPVDRAIGLYMIEQLDESGYVTADLASIALTLGCPVDRILPVLERLQLLDPVGIFARNLEECLEIQLRERNQYDERMRTLLKHLGLVANGDLAKLARLCNVSTSQLVAMIQVLRSLNPRPAHSFDAAIAHPIVPDVIMRPHHNGGWIVELNNETLPRVLIDVHYYSRISKSAKKRDDKNYISECYQSANWLIKSLHQRATTILKVATEIVKQQEGFFSRGVQELRPLILRDIAQVVEMHESTVSRVTSNKFMATPRGTFELKYFFSQAIAGSEGGSSHSAESVRHRIRSLIDAETTETVLSDDTIVDILRAEGIEIARRTVAKYRESMGLPSSVQRRRRRLTRV